jgi:hypothetical protein
MSKRLGTSLSLILPFLVSLGMLPGVANSQPEPEPEPEGDVAGDKVDLEEEAAPVVEETPYDFGNTGEENPNDPNSEFKKQQKKPEEAKKKKKRVYEGYPDRVIDRPLTLPGSTSEVSFALPVLVDPYAFGATLRGTYAITSDVQVGLRYGLGAFTEDGFNVGKAVSLDTQYRFTDNISAQVAIPAFLDPFAVGLVLGAPMRFKFFDTFLILVGEDLVSIKLHEFFPSIDNAGQNAANILRLETNEITPLWLGTASVRGVYQWSEKTALDAQFGFQVDDRRETASTTLFNVGLLRVHNQDLDFGARLGATSLSEFVDTFGLSVFANYRI